MQYYGLKNVLNQGINEPVFYCEIDYKLRSTEAQLVERQTGDRINFQHIEQDFSLKVWVPSPGVD